MLSNDYNRCVSPARFHRAQRYLQLNTPSRSLVFSRSHAIAGSRILANARLATMEAAGSGTTGWIGLEGDAQRANPVEARVAEGAKRAPSLHVESQHDVEPRVRLQRLMIAATYRRPDSRTTKIATRARVPCVSEPACPAQDMTRKRRPRMSLEIQDARHRSMRSDARATGAPRAGRARDRPAIARRSRTEPKRP